MKMGLFGSIFTKISGKNADEAVEKNLKLEDYEETVGRWTICIRFVEEKNPKATETVFKEISDRTDRCALILMDYNQKEQIRASENMCRLYDTDYEQLNQGHIRQILAVGKRCYDYKVRCLLAGIPEERICTEMMLEDVSGAIQFEDVDTVWLLTSLSNRIAMDRLKTTLVNSMKNME